MISIMEQAIRLAMRGIPVFPCTQNKRPAFKGWRLDATNDLELVEMRHWDEYDYDRHTDRSGIGHCGDRHRPSPRWQ